MSLLAKDIVQKSRVSVPKLCVEPGQCLVICGPNGSGKSSLLRVLGGVDRPTRGRVTLSGKDVGQMSPLERASHLAWLPQRSDMSQAWTVEALIASARFRFFEAELPAKKKAIELLSSFGLGHLVGRLTSEISGGELQRAFIVSLVAQEASYLLLDEPSNHLDPQHQINTYRSLGRLWHTGSSVILVSHDVRLAQLLGPPERVRVLGIKSHQVLFETHLADPKLSHWLSELYDVPFISPGSSGALAVDLEADSLGRVE